MTQSERVELQQLVREASIKQRVKRTISDGRQTPEERAAAHVFASQEASFYCHTCRCTRQPSYPSTAACFNAGHNITT